MGNVKRSPQARPGNTNTLKHGGETAVKALQHGTPLTGLAARTEQEVKADLEDIGRAALVQEGAIRLHTAARLYWAAVQTAANAGDLAKLDSYCARFGWLMSSALRAWAQVKAETPDADLARVVDALEAITEAKDDEHQNAD